MSILDDLRASIRKEIELEHKWRAVEAKMFECKVRLETARDSKN
jgi:hypothetical protein